MVKETVTFMAPRLDDQPLQIQAAINEHLEHCDWEEPAWHEIPQTGYAEGIDVQIEVEDDDKDPHFGDVKAWVYPNYIHRSGYRQTDTHTVLQVSLLTQE